MSGVVWWKPGTSLRWHAFPLETRSCGLRDSDIAWCGTIGGAAGCDRWRFTVEGSCVQYCTDCLRIVESAPEPTAKPWPATSGAFGQKGGH